MKIGILGVKHKATSKNVIPAKAGIHKLLTLLDSRRSLPRACRFRPDHGIRGGSDNWGLLEGPINKTI